MAEQAPKELPGAGPKLGPKSGPEQGAHAGAQTCACPGSGARAMIRRAGAVVAGAALPPGYNKDAAKSAAKRYPRSLARALRRGAGDTWVLDQEALEALRAAELGAVWLGHATVLLRVGGRWVLTDPVFSEKIGLRVGPWTIGVGRHAPAIDPASLPRPDVILISHAHFDHLDRPSLRALAHRATRVVTARRTARLIPRGFGSVQEVDWEGEHELDGFGLRALRPAHWGARTVWDRFRGYNSYVLSDGASRVLYAGDTAHSQAFAGAGPVDLSIFGIGAYDPWIDAHATPEQVWAMHEQASGKFLLPMHHSTFELSDEPMDEPLQRLVQAAGGRAAEVIGRELGQVWTQRKPM